MNQSKFSHHSPCPKCGSKDNLGVWADGHKYCFGCRYWEPPDGTIEGLKSRMIDNNNDKIDNVFDYTNYTYDLPKIALAWLDKYGITKFEIHEFNLLWNEKTQSLCFPVFGTDDKVKVTCERYFGSDPLHPKYIVNGHKNENYTFILNQKNTHNLVFTEDFVSAIKVARFASVCPLLGATVGINALQYAIGNFKAVRVWLDFDKATQSIREASRMSQFLPDTKSIITQLDPKEYTNNDLLKILKESGIA